MAGRLTRTLEIEGRSVVITSGGDDAPTAKLQFGGQQRTLVMDINAMIAVEEAGGSLNFDLGNMNLIQVRALLWGALQNGDDPPTIQQVGSWLHVGNMNFLAAVIAELFAAALPDTAEPGADPTPPTRTAARTAARRR